MPGVRCFRKWVCYRGIGKGGWDNRRGRVVRSGNLLPISRHPQCGLRRSEHKSSLARGSVPRMLTLGSGKSAPVWRSLKPPLQSRHDDETCVISPRSALCVYAYRSARVASTVTKGPLPGSPACRHAIELTPKDGHQLRVCGTSSGLCFLEFVDPYLPFKSMKGQGRGGGNTAGVILRVISLMYLNFLPSGHVRDSSYADLCIAARRNFNGV